MVSTCLSLFVVPAFYVTVDRVRRYVRPRGIMGRFPKEDDHL